MPHPTRSAGATLPPAAIAAGTLTVTVLYAALNMVFIYATPLWMMTNPGVPDIGFLSAENLFGREIGATFELLMALAIVSTVNAMVIVGPRVYFAMAATKPSSPPSRTFTSAGALRSMRSSARACVPLS
jgi:amino acid transporter